MANLIPCGVIRGSAGGAVGIGGLRQATAQIIGVARDIAQRVGFAKLLAELVVSVAGCCAERVGFAASTTRAGKDWPFGLTVSVWPSASVRLVMPPNIV